VRFLLHFKQIVNETLVLVEAHKIKGNTLKFHEAYRMLHEKFCVNQETVMAKLK